MSDPQAEPKIVVDEDWKSRVQAEKEAAARQDAGSEPADQVDAEAAAGEPLPAASFELLISTLTAQALTAMGKLPYPVQGHAVVRPDLAKHYIDLLGMLEQKTKGNLTKDEAGMLDEVLHQLRMTFVTTRREAAAGKGTT
jgi:nucleoid-associated protein YgaU